MRPFWLERQRDLTGPDFTPDLLSGRDVAHEPDPANVTHRSWSMVGTVATPDRGVVDPRGLVTPGSPGAGRGWSLDWWVGGDDRWHAPAQEAAVRQRLVGDAPVIETLMRIPGGDAVQRVYAIHASTDSPFGQAFLIVEIENASAVPFALALAVRPYNPTGYVPVHTIAMEGSGQGSDQLVVVNGEVGLVLPKAPSRAMATTAADGDVADAVFAGEAPEGFDAVRCGAGRAEAAFIYPLPHTAVLRVALPLGGPTRPRRRGPSMRFPAAVPSAEQVAKGWETQTRRGMRLSLPDPVWETAVEAGRRWLLLAHGGEDLAAWPERPLDWVTAEPVLGALGEQGFHEEAAQVLATLPERQGLDGSLMAADGSTAGNGAALLALARHVDLTADLDLAETLVGPVAKAVHWIDKQRRARRGPPLTPEARAWSLVGLRAAANLAERIDQPGVAADARAAAEALASAAGDGEGNPGRLGRGTTGEAPELSGVAVVDPVRRAGLSPMHTLRLARAELAAGDSAALERFAWVLSVVSPTWTWPEVVHPRTGDGSAGAGHDPATGAEVLRFVRDLLVREVGDGLALCSVLPAGWRGQGLEVHDAPTAYGRLSFALRWHGARPALLWDLDLHPGVGPVVLTAPGIDPGWRATEAKGEALLAAPVATPEPPADERPGDEPIGERPPEPGASFS
ncbi:MAG TPA: hypothetical protein VIJ47_05845 [Acidimicrobiales bacterium]